MNFFQAQAKADKNTSYLIFAFGIGVIVLLFIINGFIISLLAIVAPTTNSVDSFIPSLKSHVQSGSWIFISLAILLVVLIGSFYQAYKLKKGGKAVVEDLGAKLLIRDSANRKEKILLNIVDEISIASGIPPPAVYTLNDETINAFASGFATDDAIVCFTKGAIENLSRRELQGVVAHEFSHIFNGDMNLFMKTSSIIYGILAISVVGYWILRSSSSSKMDKDSASALIFLLVLGLGLIILGYIGMFIGNLIQASISRQREFSADATAVQFTRDNTGIANALKKIYTQGSTLGAKNAQTYSHFYFSNGIKRSFFKNLLATHPPLYQRILRVEPDWSGDFKDFKQKTEDTQQYKDEKKEKLTKIVTTSLMLDSLDKSGVIFEKDIQNANERIKDIPNIFIYMSQSPFTSQALILALISKDIHEVPQEILNEFAIKNPKLFRQMQLVFKNLADLKQEDYLPMLLLCIPSLKTMSKNQYIEFRNLLLEWIWSNQKIIFFEWIIKRVIISTLDSYFELTKPTNQKYKQINQLEKECSYFISFLSQHEAKSRDLAKELFYKAINNKIQTLTYIELETLDYIEFGKNLDKIILADSHIKKELLTLAIFILSDNGNLSIQNQQMLNTLSLSLKIPLSL